MKLQKKVSIAASLFIMLSPMAISSAQDWIARSVEQISSDLQISQDNKLTYVVKYGDTLSAIAAAMDIDVSFLAEVNQIKDLNLIYPDTVLTAQMDEQQHTDKLSIETVDGQTHEIDVPVNLTPQAENQELVPAEMVDQTTKAEAEEENLVQLVPEAEDFVEEVQTPETTEIVNQETAQEFEEVPEAEESNALANEEAEKGLMVASNIDFTPVLSSSPSVDEEDTIEVEVSTDEEIAETTVEELPVADLPVVENSSNEVSQPVEELVQSETTENTNVVPEPVEEAPAPQVPQAPETPNYSIPSSLSGVSQAAAAYGSRIANQYGVTALGLRPGDNGDHGKGLAIDLMVPQSSALGDQIAADAIGRMNQADDVKYVIWKQRFFDRNTGDQGRMMEDRGSITQNHYDHVHVSFNY